jgi:hypothetical protein
MLYVIIKKFGLDVDVKELIIWSCLVHRMQDIMSTQTEIINTSQSVEKFKYFGTIVGNQNCMREEIEGRLTLGNV